MDKTTLISLIFASLMLMFILGFVAGKTDEKMNSRKGELNE